MTFKDKFNELGYKLIEEYMVNIDLIINDSFSIRIDYDKRKIVVFNSVENSLCEMSQNLLEILYEYLQEKRFFKDE